MLLCFTKINLKVKQKFHSSLIKKTKTFNFIYKVKQNKDDKIYIKNLMEVTNDNHIYLWCCGINQMVVLKMKSTLLSKQRGKKLGRPQGSKDKGRRRKSGYYRRWGNK
ncbi:unnamed protein product [marine sediment metagenome]|uniref:Uncharacterized protein n=1 Tax=marine sediment metagenome TaxID=412755 RepID=X1FJV5_9ZZZZ